MQKLISTVMIVKNEEEIIENCLNSIKDISDEIIVVDTGSTDNTIDVAKKVSKKVKIFEIPFVNFVETKNEALKLASCRYILWMDADEVLYQGADILRIHAEEGQYDSISTKITEGSLEDYSIISCQYNRLRLWKNNGKYKFVGPGVHEVVVGEGSSIFDLRILVRHEHTKSDKASTAKERFTKYIDILKDSINKGQDLTRAWFYLGRTYLDLNRHSEAISAYIKYLSFKDNYYNDEIWQAHYDIARCYKMTGDYDHTISWIEKAKTVDDRRSEIDCLLADIYFQRQEYDLAAQNYKKALREIPNNVVLFLNPQYYYSYPKDQLVMCYYYLNKFKESLEILNELISVNNKDNRLLENHYWIHKKANPTIFMTLGNTPEDIYGGILEDRGVGGVETTYIELSLEFVMRGFTVFLFCNTKESHVFQNVYYVPYQEIDQYFDIKPDVIITSRWFDPLYREDDSKKIIWYQDAFFGLPNNFEDLFNKTDLVVCSSKWHHDYIFERLGRLIKKDKLKIIPLGIRKDLFINSFERDLNKVIYSSNPDRGLESLIDMWDEICENLPDIKLSVTYGWEGLKTWSEDSSFHQNINRLQEKCFKKAEKYNNIVFTGRLTKKELSKELLSSSILVYPNNFWETFCLTALEAQISGLPIITTDMGALSTVVNRDYNFLIPGSPFSEEYQRSFIDILINLYKQPENIKNLSDKNRLYFLNASCDWSNICDLWVNTIYYIF